MRELARRAGPIHAIASLHGRRLAQRFPSRCSLAKPGHALRVGLLACLTLLTLSCAEGYDFGGGWSQQPGSYTIVNYEHGVKLTFPNDRWRLITEPEVGVPWSPYHVLLADSDDDDSLTFQLLIDPRRIELHEYLRLANAGAEKLSGGEMKVIESKVVERRGRRVGLSIVKNAENADRRSVFMIFKEQKRIVLVGFGCAEKLCESANELFWAIADSYDSIERPGATAAHRVGEPDDVPAPDLFPWIYEGADQGHATDQFYLGSWYETGQGVAQDDAEAARWYRKAADQGHATAQFNLGVMYDEGRGVAQDDAEAVRWYRKAAEQGDARAQRNLGSMYETGRGVPKDEEEASRWYRAAGD